MYNHIYKNSHILLIIIVILCLYIFSELSKLAVNEYPLIHFLTISFYITAIVTLIVKLMAINKQFLNSLRNLGNKQIEIEKKIEKLVTQTQKLDNKLLKITNITSSKLNVSDLEKLDAPDDTLSFLNKQPELSGQTKPKNLLIDEKKINPISWEILLKALHFPRDKNDLAGFSALKIAHENNIISELLRVSEDFLNLIAQDGIYLDDLKIDPPPVESWLNFVTTDQKTNKKRLGCVGIDIKIKKLKSRIKTDAIFRDTSLTLMRRFDRLLRDKLRTANDEQIFKIAETRSGKAFLIVGKISDSF